VKCQYHAINETFKLQTVVPNQKKTETAIWFQTLRTANSFQILLSTKLHAVGLPNLRPVRWDFNLRVLFQPELNM